MVKIKLCQICGREKPDDEVKEYLVQSDRTKKCFRANFCKPCAAQSGKKIT